MRWTITRSNARRSQPDPVHFRFKLILCHLRLSGTKILNGLTFVISTLILSVGHFLNYLGVTQGRTRIYCNSFHLSFVNVQSHMKKRSKRKMIWDLCSWSLAVQVDWPRNLKKTTTTTIIIKLVHVSI